MHEQYLFRRTGRVISQHQPRLHSSSLSNPSADPSGGRNDHSLDAALQFEVCDYGLVERLVQARYCNNIFRPSCLSKNINKIIL